MSARHHAILGFGIAALLFGMTHWLPGGGGPVFAADFGVSSLKYDESTLYSPGARRFADTLCPAWELDVIELRDARFSYPITHQIVLGVIAKLAGGVERAYMLGHSLLPACVWLLFYMLMLAGKHDAALASAAAWTACLAAAAPRNALLLGEDSFTQALELTRTPHPALSTAVLALALWALTRSLSQSGFKWPLIAGLCMGGLFYTYYFHAVAGWAALGGLFLISVFQREKGEWKELGIIALIGILVAVPYLFWTLASMRSGITRELMGRIGWFHRIPDVKALFGLAAAILLSLWLAKRGQGRSPAARVLAALLAGAFFVANLHLVTGYNAQHEHAYNRLLQPFGVLLAAVLLPVPRTRLLHVVSAVWIGLAACRQAMVARHEKKQTVPEAALASLNALDGGQVVAVMDGSLRGILPVKTPHWSFVPFGCRTLASNEEILIRFIVMAKLAGASKDETRALLHGKAQPGQFRTFCWDLLVSYEPREADAELFESLWDKTDPSAVLQTRRLDVLLLPDKAAAPEVLGFLFSPIFAADGWRAFFVTKC